MVINTPLVYTKVPFCHSYPVELSVKQYESYMVTNKLLIKQTAVREGKQLIEITNAHI